MRVAITAFVFTLGLALGVGIGNQRLRRTPESSTGPAVASKVLHIAPPTLSRFYVTPHAPSELQELGDKDGIDYIPARFTNGQLRIHHGAGLQNEDFVGFGMQVLAPLSGKVIRVRHPSGVNALGKMSESEVGLVAIQATNGAVLVLAHLAKIPVEEGSHVEIGSALGFISNNGSSRNPHIHLGAFRNGQSMLIEFDRNALDATLTKVGEMGH